ncbi:hypothetical protein [Ornithinimicrobium panacihumi]|uniref:hypothetical protein n=1 Tax=Ornithinimicrobium panacihumi TaxID=2008449 RepID=UPI003F89F8C3
MAPQADHVVFLDEEAQHHFESRVASLAPAARTWSAAQARDALREESAWRQLAHGLRELDALAPNANRPLSKVLPHIAALLGDAGEGGTQLPTRMFEPEDVASELRRLARWALRRGKFPALRSIIAMGEEILARSGGSRIESDAFAALTAHAELVEGSRSAEEPVVTLVSAVLEHADSALRAEDLDEASELGAIALGLLFHQQLHTAREHTPLVTETETYLEPLRSSYLGQCLAGALTRGTDTSPSPETAPEVGPAGDAMRVAILPGAYPNHAKPMIQALVSEPGVQASVITLDRGQFGGMMIDTPILRHCLEHAIHGTSSVDLRLDPDIVEIVRTADVVVADWADKGAAWASTVVRPDARMVVRVHSVDVLSAPAHLLDWSRVDDIVFVSEHIRDLFRSVLGHRVSHATHHVVTNIVPPENFPDPLLPDASRTLGIVGWAQVVKDPLFALDVLERLIAVDPSWRLRLIGADFGDHHAAWARAYADEFRRRALSSPLVDHIDYSGFTRRLPDQLRHVGFILNTSLRESCPVGTLEGTAAGAFPVVRDWPAFAPLDGARRMFPADVVVSTPEEAAELVLRLSQENRAEAAREVRQRMSSHFSDDDTRGRLLSIIVSPPSAPSRGPRDERLP